LLRREAEAVSDCRRFGRRSDTPTEVSVCDRRLRQANRNSRTVTDAAHASIRRFRAFALSKSEIALSKSEVWGVRGIGMPSTSDVPSLRYVRGQPSFDAGTNLVPALLGRNPDELENSEDCRSAGGHGNQHVRLRGASIDVSTVCPAPATACCRGPGKLSDPNKLSDPKSLHCCRKKSPPLQ
jgi:hypothetical protein